MLESYANLLPEKIDALGPEERRHMYRMLEIKVHPDSEGGFSLEGTINSSNMVISSA